MSRISFVRSLAEELEREALLERDARVVVGVSGGADSMALLHVLGALNAECGYALKLHIGHLDHQLRGSQSEADAAFVQAAADDMQVPCTIERCDVADRAAQGGGSVEETARRERYGFLERLCVKVGAQVVAVGHQRDDDAETVLHRVIRGTGLRGLAGIPRVRPLRQGSPIRLIRPLLRRDRKAILAYLAECSVPYCEDATNREVSSATRNRIRHEVLPLLEKQINPQVREALLRLAEQARWLTEFFGETVDRSFETLIIAHTDQELVLNAAALGKKSRIIQTELIRRAVLTFGVGEQDLGFAQLVAVLELVGDPASGKEVHLPRGMTVSKRYDRLTFSMPTDEPRETVASEIAVHVPGRTLLPVRRLEIRVEVQEVDQAALWDWLERQRELSDAPAAARQATGNMAEEWVDADRVVLPLVVRARFPGDRFWPLGAPGSKKVSEFLRDSKVEPLDRERVAVLCDRLGPIWVIGHRIDERVKLTPHTSRVLQLEARRVEP